MINRNPTNQEIEMAAQRLGASRVSVFKWRKRGIPAHWKIKLIEDFGGALSFRDLETFAAPCPSRLEPFEAAQ